MPIEVLTLADDVVRHLKSGSRIATITFYGDFAFSYGHAQNQDKNNADTDFLIPANVSVEFDYDDCILKNNESQSHYGRKFKTLFFKRNTTNITKIYIDYTECGKENK